MLQVTFVNHFRVSAGASVFLSSHAVKQKPRSRRVVCSSGLGLARLGPITSFGFIVTF